MDFLSYLSKDRPTQPIGAVLVLNTTNLWRRALPYISDQRFEEVRLYLDNDAAGDAATARLFEAAENSDRLADMRHYYAGFEASTPGFSTKSAKSLSFFFSKIKRTTTSTGTP